jgi:hypothetical protein
MAHLYELKHVTSNISKTPFNKKNPTIVLDYILYTLSHNGSYADRCGQMNQLHDTTAVEERAIMMT